MLSEQAAQLIAPALVVASVHSEIARDAQGAALYAQLLVAEDKVDLVVGDRRLARYGRVDFSIGERNNPTPL